MVTALTGGLQGRLGIFVRSTVVDPVVCLTFDDGPDATFTPLLLDLLNEHGASATFFLDGPAAERQRTIVHRINDDGHEIGLHGWSHTSAETAPMHGLRAQVRDLRRAKLAVSAPASLYRPPYGHESRWTRLAANLCGLQLVYWSASTEDWTVGSVDELANRIRDALRPGAVVLMHDRLRNAADPQSFDRGSMIQALSEVLTELSGTMRFVTVSTMMAMGKPVFRRRRHMHDPLEAMYEQTD